MRWKDTCSSALSLSSWEGGGEETCREELLQVGAQDAEVKGVVDASSIDGALQEAMDKLPLEVFTTLKTSEQTRKAINMH